MFGMKPPGGVFNANPGAPTIFRVVFRPIGRPRWISSVTYRPLAVRTPSELPQIDLFNAFRASAIGVWNHLYDRGVWAAMPDSFRWLSSCERIAECPKLDRVVRSHRFGICQSSAGHEL